VTSFNSKAPLFRPFDDKTILVI